MSNAVFCTGNGKIFIRPTAVVELAARVRFGGQPLEEAAAALVEELGKREGRGRTIVPVTQGARVLLFSSSGMYREFADAQGKF